MKPKMLITGGTGYLGQELITRFHRDYEVYFTWCSSRVRMEDILSKYDIPEDNALHLDFDKPELVSQIFDGKVFPYFIHAATLRHNNTILSELKLEDVERIIRINFTTPLMILKTLISNYKLDKPDIPAKYILISSVVSETGLIKGSMYASTKAAMDNIVRSIAREEGRNNIFINSILPGAVETSFEDFSEEYRPLRIKYFESWKKNVPLKKLCKLEDIVNLAEFLISGKNSYITGQLIRLNGGYS